ncbi:MAG: flagellar basal body P-ring protein FlgI [Deltaproteobacteria bacterium]|nr:flagellar basal body P-ring protein FlgI [Deltaproteobacteria bacterium]
MRSLRALGLAALLLVVFALPAQAVRIKDIGRAAGVRGNQLVGYGLVIGLDRTGDTQRSAFTLQSLSSMLSRLGVRVDPKDLILRDVAAVMITATLPALAKPGTPIDVTVSAIGDARSLEGGTLVLTPLLAVNGQTYAMAQGPIQVGGFGAVGRSGSRLVQNHLNVGRIPSGAIVERSVPLELAEGGVLRIQLDRPDFATAQAVAQAVEGAAPALGGAAGMARAVDAGVVEVTVPAGRQDAVASFIADVEVLTLTPDFPARVVINGRTGTVVMGEDVQIGAVAVSHGPLTIEVQERPVAVQPAPLAAGETAIVPSSRITAERGGPPLKMVAPATTLQAVVRSLNALGASPRDLVEILQAMHAAGAIHAELVVL